LAFCIEAHAPDIATTADANKIRKERNMNIVSLQSEES